MHAIPVGIESCRKLAVFEKTRSRGGGFALRDRPLRKGCDERSTNEEAGNTPKRPRRCYLHSENSTATYSNRK